MTPISFHQSSIRKILSSLDISKTPGSDGIPAIFFKNCAPGLTPVLCRLFSLSFDSGICPDCWKLALVQPIPNKGDKSLPSNYRPISLVSILSKVTEKAINSQLLSHLEQSSLFSDRFRGGRSAGDLLLYTTHLWNSNIEKYGKTLAVALDLSKAFDRVWHDAFLNKLPSFGLQPNLCKRISSFLNHRSFKVMSDGALSKSFPMNAGVPQDSVLSMLASLNCDLQQIVHWG